MVVNFEYKFVFIHVPKTAGTSIARMLKNLKGSGPQSKFDFRRLLGGEALAKKAVSKTTKHETYLEFLERFEERTKLEGTIARQLLPIAFARHPYDRFSSLHRYLLQKQRAKYPDVPLDINDFAALVGRESHPWIDTIRSLKPQSDFIVGAPDDFFLGRFERLAESIEELNAMLGVTLELPHLNQSDGVAQGSGLTADSKRIIFLHYESDFSTFDYEP